MIILDKLVERKDILKYIDARIEKLKLNLKLEMKHGDPKTKQYRKKIFVGRFKELRNLKGVIHQKEEKELSEKYWEETRGITHD